MLVDLNEFLETWPHASPPTYQDIWRIARSGMVPDYRARANKIRDFLKDRRLYVVSKETGISYSALLRIVNNTTDNPSIKTIEKLEQYFAKQ
jgi:hypothetical protein